MMDKQRIDEIKTRCEAATPGPWLMVFDGAIDECKVIDVYGCDIMLTSVFDDGVIRIYEKNADFAAHAREDIPFLLSELDRMTAERNRGSDTVTKETSDGHHTFGELYDHRHALFAALCNSHQDMSWKSRLHDDGTMYDGMFLAWIMIPDIGVISYHVDLKYWPLFEIPEFERALPYDGHTPVDVLQRLCTARWNGNHDVIRHLKAERDAAVADMAMIANMRQEKGSGYRDGKSVCDFCKYGDGEEPYCYGFDCFHWRGFRKEEKDDKERAGSMDR